MKNIITKESVSMKQQEQSITQTSTSQEKPSKNADKSAQIKALYPYTPFDLWQARYRLYEQFNVDSKWHQAIIEVLTDKINGQFKKYHNMKPQIGYGETVPITDEKVAEQVKCKKSTVKAVRLLYQKAGLWKVERAKGKYGHSRPGVWIYAFTGYLTLDEEQPKMMVQEVEEDILEIDFKGADSTVCTDTKSKSRLTQMLVQTDISEVSEQPSNPDYDSVSEVSKSSANKVSYQNNLKSSSIEGKNGEEEDINKAKKAKQPNRNEPTQVVPSIVEKTLVKVSKIRMNEKGNPHPVLEAEKKQFRVWLDEYAHKRSKDMSIDYEQALIILPLAWDLANKASRHYRPETPMYFANGRSNKYAMEYLHDALALWENGGEFEPQEQQEQQEVATVDIETILGQDFDNEQAETDDEYEVRLYIQKFKTTLIQGAKFGKCPVERLTQMRTIGEKAERLGKETVEKLLRKEGVIS